MSIDLTFKIDNFNNLSENTQQWIQDMMVSEGVEFQVVFHNHCDVCNAESDLIKIESEGGVIRVCDNCKKNVSNIIDKSLLNYSGD